MTWSGPGAPSLLAAVTWLPVCPSRVCGSITMSRHGGHNSPSSWLQSVFWRRRVQIPVCNRLPIWRLYYRAYWPNSSKSDLHSACSTLDRDILLYWFSCVSSHPSGNCPNSTSNQDRNAFSCISNPNIRRYERGTSELLIAGHTYLWGT